MNDAPPTDDWAWSEGSSWERFGRMRLLRCAILTDVSITIVALYIQQRHSTMQHAVHP